MVIVTAYSSTPDQTDSSPFITANGSRVRDGIVAANFLPFGTKVKFPEYSGDKIYTVQDRMAKKNSHKIDIWMPTRHAALDFGVKKLAYEVVE
ncbi:3D domain-containing protein [Patescibacteria group bacterium]|nr:3D domain-containing protein [Patescibacteria group bacterium]MBU2219613.1 3D domain-containing protein [Patescibacteria group bacterium]MBU2265348.1 3D domain-containing protein [Patescibacteria group bacterium]